MRTSPEVLLAYLASLGVEAETVEHPPLFTVEDSRALRSDIADIQGGTTAEGVHLGAMAGSVDLLQRCFAGLETRQDALWFNPHWPRRFGQLQHAGRQRVRRRRVYLPEGVHRQAPLPAHRPFPYPRRPAA